MCYLPGEYRNCASWVNSQHTCLLTPFSLLRSLFTYKWQPPQCCAAFLPCGNAAKHNDCFCMLLSPQSTCKLRLTASIGLESYKDHYAYFRSKIRGWGISTTLRADHYNRKTTLHRRKSPLTNTNRLLIFTVCYRRLQ